MTEFPAQYHSAKKGDGLHERGPYKPSIAYHEHRSGIHWNFQNPDSAEDERDSSGFISGHFGEEEWFFGDVVVRPEGAPSGAGFTFFAPFSRSGWEAVSKCACLGLPCPLHRALIL